MRQSRNIITTPYPIVKVFKVLPLPIAPILSAESGWRRKKDTSTWNRYYESIWFRTKRTTDQQKGEGRKEKKTIKHHKSHRSRITHPAANFLRCIIWMSTDPIFILDWFTQDQTKDERIVNKKVNTKGHLSSWKGTSRLLHSASYSSEPSFDLILST